MIDAMRSSERPLSIAGGRTAAARRAAWAAAALASLLAAGCRAGASNADGVRRVEAKIDGITCAACVPPLTASLRRQFAHAVNIDVDDARDTATLRLDARQDFTPAALRQAVADVRMRVTGVRLEACGRVEASGDDRWLAAGAHRFRLRGASQVPLQQPVCVDGRLDAGEQADVLDVQHVSTDAARAGS